MTEDGEPSAIRLLQAREQKLIAWLVCPGAIGLKELQLEILYSKCSQVDLVPDLMRRDPMISLQREAL